MSFTAVVSPAWEISRIGQQNNAMVQYSRTSSNKGNNIYSILRERGENNFLERPPKRVCPRVVALLPLVEDMPTFQSKSYGKTSPFQPLLTKAKKHPFLLFGLPFIGIIVGGSFGLAQITQTRYDHRDLRHRKVEKEEKLGMDKNRRKLSLQEEYWRLQAKTEEDWDQIRIQRPPGVEE